MGRAPFCARSKLRERSARAKLASEGVKDQEFFCARGRMMQERRKEDEEQKALLEVMREGRGDLRAGAHEEK